MSKFVDGIEFHVEACPNCHIHYAIPNDLYQSRQRDHETVFCPNGHRWNYTGESIEQKELRETKNALHQQTMARTRAESDAKESRQKYKRIRMRVQKGICPCCDTLFTDLRDHMATDHQLGPEGQMKTLREIFGLTQADLAKEAAVKVAHVSKFETGRPVASFAHDRLKRWLERVA